MALRFGWGSNAGDTLGDVKAALASTSFGDASATEVALTTAAAGITPDLSLGENFYYTAGLVTAVTNTSLTKFNAPINGGEGSKLRIFLRLGAHSFGALTFATAYRNAPYTGTKLAAAATKVIEFTYHSPTQTWVQTNAGRPAAGNIVA